MRTIGFLVSVVAALASLAGGMTPAAAATRHRASGSGIVYFRSVLCFAPSFNPAVPNPGPLRASSCSPESRLNDDNLGVSPDNKAAAGFSSQNVPPDAALAGVPSTNPAKETAAATVLLPGLGQPEWPGAARYVLGPAEMTSASVAQASASKDQTGAWVVKYSMTNRGSRAWDEVAEENFHKLLSIDFNGKVVSAPVIQPTQISFSSFNGRGEISDNLTKAEAIALAHALHHG